ncbi:MAG TPA: SMP-30/gluconolactonase/LRE family protein [Hymenobacter sp.]|uniref:SMP-30/gluconolactonase/LRE family protein n=1 Tax=Hymenobacter sp. TaxID=1898978 RepID=UPI002D7F7A4A|nr:SMP-30/gluconolactonase/LRE family protein [Hymenobacter sp.]HET9502955.1 SMP-30/gluconolactonase/LRE family protein [Hymenobacter sp.]
MRTTWIRIGRWSLLAAVGGVLLTGAARAHARRRAKEQAQDTGLFAGSPTPQLVARQFTFTEGPAVDKAGNVYFTDQPNNQIWKYDLRGQLSVFMDPAGRANGMYFDAKGNLIACADEKNQLWSIAPDKKVTVLVDQPPGHRLNGPNDVWVAPGGGMYFTDPYYQRDYWQHTAPEQPGQYVYYLAPGQHQPTVVETTLKKPNGIIGTRDGKTLYVADIEGDKTYRYQLGPTGALAGRQLFVEQGSDGMTLDERGNVYLTGKGVTVYSPAGERLAHLDVPEEWTGNICFGGKDRKTLFITASKGVYVVPMRVRGGQ